MVGERTGPEGERGGKNEGKRVGGKGPQKTLEEQHFFWLPYDSKPLNSMVCSVFSSVKVSGPLVLARNSTPKALNSLHSGHKEVIFS